MQMRTEWNVQETKLIPPLRPGGLIERRRLMSEALHGTERRLLLVLGTAGFGKSSLLASVHRELSAQARQVSWISLDAADNDHARFLSHLVHAFRVHNVRFGAGISTLLGSGAPLPASTFRTGLLNELAALDHPIHLFLDDYHLITDAEVQKTVNAMLMAPLRQLHLAIASRARNALPINRLRSQGEIGEITGADLAFSEDETRAFLAGNCRRELDHAGIALLHERTEGWAASLQLASIALDQTGDVPTFLSCFSGETRNVGEYLVEEVLRQQRPELQQFLLDLSVLQRFNLRLAADLAQREDAATLIAEIVERNLFILALDDRHHWHRFHHLFSNFLRRRLRDRDPQRIPELHRRAAGALIRQGLEIEAIEHALLAGDTEQAGRLLDETCGQLFATGQIATLQQHAARLAPEQLRMLPRLQLELSWDQEIQWRFADARTTIGNIADTLHGSGATSAPLRDEQRALLKSKLLHREMMLELFTDRRQQALALCRRWRDEGPADDPFMCASVGTAIMLIERERHDCEATESKAQELRAMFEAGGAVYGTIFHDSVAGATMFMRGDVGSARDMLERARDCAQTLAGADSAVAAMPTALLAEICYESGELLRAGELLKEHHASSAEFGFLDQAIARFVTTSRLAFAENRTDDAGRVLEAGFFVAARHDFPRLTAHLVAERVRQLVLLDRVCEAQAVLEQPDVASWMSELSPGEQASTTDEFFAVAWARVAIARGEPARAIRLLKRWLGHLRPRRAHRATLRMGVLLAHAQLSAGDTNAALRLLREMLALMPGGGFVRSFGDEGSGIVALLHQLHEDLAERDAALRPLLATILEHYGESGECGERNSSPAIAGEALSRRELEILEHSAEGMATTDIARAAHLSENTVKWYWQRIFAKLGVHRRFDAIRMARRKRWMN